MKGEFHVVRYPDIKVGMLLVFDFDGFMLGYRLVVKEKRDDGSFYAQRYELGELFPYRNCDAIITAQSTYPFWYKEGETLEEWKEKFNKKPPVCMQTKELEQIIKTTIIECGMSEEEANTLKNKSVELLKALDDTNIKHSTTVKLSNDKKEIHIHIK